MDLSSYYDGDGDVIMGQSHPTGVTHSSGEAHYSTSKSHLSFASLSSGGIHPSGSETTHHSSEPARSIEVEGGVEESKTMTAHEPGLHDHPGSEEKKPIDYRKMRAEARKKRYPSYFKGRSDPSASEKKEEEKDKGCFFKPDRLAAKPEVDMSARLTVKMDKQTKQIVDALAADNGKVFASFLKHPPSARKAIHRLLRMKLPSFEQVRILTLWHLLRKSHADNLGIGEEDQEAVCDYLAEVHELLEFTFLAETRKRLMVTLDEPSWLWLDFFKRVWAPEMGQALKEAIQRLGPRRVMEGITPLIQAYHAKHKPFRTFGAKSRSAFPSSSSSSSNATEIEIPSLWYRSIFYPLLGGEPLGLFDDTPMSFKETLATMIS